MGLLASCRAEINCGSSSQHVDSDYEQLPDTRLAMRCERQISMDVVETTPDDCLTEKPDLSRINTPSRYPQISEALKTDPELLQLQNQIKDLSFQSQGFKGEMKITFEKQIQQSQTHLIDILRDRYGEEETEIHREYLEAVWSKLLVDTYTTEKFYDFDAEKFEEIFCPQGKRDFDYDEFLQDIYYNVVDSADEYMNGEDVPGTIFLIINVKNRKAVDLLDIRDFMSKKLFDEVGRFQDLLREFLANASTDRINGIWQEITNKTVLSINLDINMNSMNSQYLTPTFEDMNHQNEIEQLIAKGRALMEMPEDLPSLKSSLNATDDSDYKSYGRFGLSRKTSDEIPDIPSTMHW